MVERDELSAKVSPNAAVVRRRSHAGVNWTDFPGSTAVLLQQKSESELNRNWVEDTHQIPTAATILQLSGVVVRKVQRTLTKNRQISTEDFRSEIQLPPNASREII